MCSAVGRAAPIAGVLCAFASAAPAHADDALAARDPLAEARAALAAERFDDALALSAQAPGLAGRALEGKGDTRGACALYERERASATRSAVAGSLRAARCRDRAGDVGGALAAWLEVGASPLGGDAALLAELAAFVDRRALAVPASLDGALVLPVGPFDVAARDALARALDVIRRRGSAPSAARAAARLTDELFDTAVGKALPAPRIDDLAAALPRARALDATHESAALTALLTPLVHDKDVSAEACEARLLLGRAWRKLRKYAAAKRQLAVAASRCGDDVQRRASFLEARVALISRSVSGPALAERFVSAWPADTLSDDLLFLVGEAREQGGDEAGARAAWQRIVSDHSDGDQIHDARFRLALALARAGDGAAALSALDDAARHSGERVDVLDRASYWRARLKAFPQLQTLEPTADDVARTEGLDGLRALAVSRPASFYGHLARLLWAAQLPAAARDEAVARALSVPAGVRAGARDASVLPSSALRTDGRFSLARALVDSGYDDEARALIGTLDTARAAPEDLVSIALLLGRVGAPGAGHALLRARGRALLPGRPGDDTVLAWSVGWPRAYASAIEPAADEARVPRALLFGLAREESAFDADVVSWAGAVGLCQLMPPTANDEAKALGLPPPSIASLRAPVLNARLGAAHLGRRTHGMRHPLLAIAAYNAGPGAVAKWSPRGPVDTWVEQIPVEETRNYVKKVTGSWVTYSVLDGSVDDVRFGITLR